MKPLLHQQLLKAALLLIGLINARADSVVISWEPPPLTNGITGYQVSVTIGTNIFMQANLAGVYSTQQVVSLLIPGTNYTATVRSMNGPNLLAAPVSSPFVIPSSVINLKINSTMQQSTTPYGPWEDVTNMVVEVAATTPGKFYRSKLDTLRYLR